MSLSVPSFSLDVTYRFGEGIWYINMAFPSKYAKIFQFGPNFRIWISVMGSVMYSDVESRIINGGYVTSLRRITCAKDTSE